MSRTVVVVGGIVVVVVVVVVVSIVVSVVVVIESSSAVVSVTAGSETEVSVAYCDADCAPQPATTTIRKVAAIFASFTLLTLVVRDPQKSEAH